MTKVSSSGRRTNEDSEENWDGNDREMAETVTVTKIKWILYQPGYIQGAQTLRGSIADNRDRRRGDDGLD
ncbi:hypothetical protein PPTG_23414 [Phytophthora nicotianae INRA-310]|uniref:Uncharacterized protein n=2 Tax=Phytophthora nicotianae TaxID=4792 RepID=W2PZ80_PHYN3|nr:hypothetical protein PPTG_23414 [Phytophthora nicotianae INRA-310]ETN06192.1 hypothetical protein PPTG_23414 [Phytophthora nicotianae INRA-310]